MATKTITLTTDDDEEIELMVIEQTMINNVNYLLVTDSEEDEADAYILKDTQSFPFFARVRRIPL